MAYKLVILLAVFVYVVNCSVLLGREQSVAAKGQLRCKGRIASGILVKLIDHNKVLSDNILDQEYSDSSGNFYVSGHHEAVTSLDPRLKIYHSCGRSSQTCSKIIIPKTYVSNGETPLSTYDVGVFNLETPTDSC